MATRTPSGATRQNTIPLMWVLCTSGRGPGECQIAVRELTNRFLDEAKLANIAAHLLDAPAGPHGLLSALIAIEGDQVESLVKSWEGTICWVCPSPIRKNWPRKNWFVAINVLRPPAPAVALQDSDLRFTAFHASGPGGQHVNTTNSAVRVEHLPTKLVAQAQEERSQYRNKALALARLAALLTARAAAAKQATEHARWTKHDALERGNPVRTYRGPDFVMDRR